MSAIAQPDSLLLVVLEVPIGTSGIAGLLLSSGPVRVARHIPIPETTVHPEGAATQTPPTTRYPLAAQLRQEEGDDPEHEEQDAEHGRQRLTDVS